MLACAQDLFFNNDEPLARQDLIPTNLQQQSSMSSNSFNQQQPKFTKKSSHMIAHHISEKDKEEVWPPEVESAFIEALESIPKLGRRKILVNGKPCGRNELISDFIFRKTSKVRTRKQVSSHIQVLKNTRKNDPHFMRLLTDAVDLEDEFVHRRTPKPAHGKRPPPPPSSSSSSSSSKQEPPFFNHNNSNNNNNHATSSMSSLPLRKLTNLNSAASISSDESSIHSSPSPADYVFDMMYVDEHALSMLDMKDPFYDSMHSSFFDPNLGMTTPSSQPSFAFATTPSSSSTPYSLMHPPSSTGMATPSLVDSVCFDLSPMDTAACAPLMPPNDMYGVQADSNEKGKPLSHPQLQQQQRQQISHLSHHQQFMQPSFPPSAQQFHTNEAMVEPLRSSTQSRKWRRGNRRQKYVNTQHSRKGYQLHAVHRHTPFMNQHKSDDLPTTTTTSPNAATSAPAAAPAITMSINPMAPNNTIPMTTIPSPSSDVMLWPNYLCFYLEYVSPDATLDSSLVNTHTLAQLPHCFPNITNSNDDLSHGTTLKERYNSLLQLNPSLSLIPSDITLFAKMKLDLNYNMNDFYFNNTCFFESKDRRMIECTTTIYSFGNIVLESKEMQQALWTPENKYMYSFAFVNQFFDAFMKGVKSLQSWEEVDIAIHNLCIVQVFEDMETKCQLLDNNSNRSAQQSYSSTASPIPPSYATNSSALSTTTLFDNNNGTPSLKSNHNNSINNNGGHLLALIYEFERGQGAIDMNTVHNQQNNNNTMNDSTCLMD